MHSTLDRVPITAARRALAKLENDDAPYALAAAFVGEVTPNDLDGCRWRLLVTDGHRLDTVDAGISGTRGGRRGIAVDAASLERAVERYSGGFDRQTRLQDLVNASPILLRSVT